jgi:hypothetical protein
MSRRPWRALLSLCLALALVAALPARSRAFCGFYVGGAEGSLYANATLVVMMREGTRTVLAMQNDYQGPVERFAMVVPVPVVLHDGDVRTLPHEVFAHVDRLTAPRLVEYWEQDPCYRPPRQRYLAGAGRPGVRYRRAPSSASSSELGVTVEAEFTVAEYDVVILSARDSAGLETWLHREQYEIPVGARAVLRPYVEAGTKFFVARVDPARVTFRDGRAVLSPLRFHYDSPDFWLPVRMGLMSSPGTQDLILHVISREGRFEVANYANATIPTNLRVTDAVRADFGAFYEGVFRDTVARHPRTVITEYAWATSSCDPCPTPVLSQSELEVLGSDVLPRGSPWDFTVTRLHYRYGPNDLTEDLVLRSAGGLTGGGGVPDRSGAISQLTGSGGAGSRFQGRYVILHEWTGPIACAHPQRGVWGGPPGGGRGVTAGQSGAMSGGAAAMTRDASAATMLVDTVDWSTLATSGAAMSLGAAVPASPPGPSDDATDDGAGPEGGGATEGEDVSREAPASSVPPVPPQRGGCASCAVGAPVAAGTGAGLALSVIAVWTFGRRRRRRR